MQSLSRKDIFQLVRLPAALSAIGDSLLGGVASKSKPGFVQSAGLVGSSVLLYTSGMALNDYADRDVDAVERPQRPIPSGRVPAKSALAIGGGLMTSGVVLAGLVGGKRAAGRAGAVAGSIVLYDFAAKKTFASPVAMGACRFLDVMLGAEQMRPAIAPAAIIGAHTVAITSVSRFEAVGGPASVGKAAMVATGAVSAATLAVSARNFKRNPLAALVSLAAVATYALPFGRSALEATKDPQPSQLQKVVGTGVMGMIPLQGALIAGAGSAVKGAVVTALWPVAQRFRRKAT